MRPLLQAFSDPVFGTDNAPAALPEPAKESVPEAPPTVGKPASILATPPEPARVAERSSAESPAAAEQPAPVELTAAVERVVGQGTTATYAEARPSVALALPALCARSPNNVV